MISIEKYFEKNKTVKRGTHFLLKLNSDSFFYYILCDTVLGKISLLDMRSGNFLSTVDVTPEPYNFDVSKKIVYELVGEYLIDDFYILEKKDRYINFYDPVPEKENEISRFQMMDIE